MERLEWADATLQRQRRKLTPSNGWKFLQGSGIRQEHLVGGCIDVFDWAGGTILFPEQWNDAILFLEPSEDMPPPDFVKYFLRVFAAMGILPQLSGILFARPYDKEERFPEYDEAILQVVRDEEGLTDLPIITRMDFGHTDPMFVLPYGILAEIDCDQRRFSILENSVS